MLWLIIFGGLCVVIFYHYCIKPMSYWKKLGVKQSNPSWLFGDNLNTFLKREGFTDLIIRLYNEHPNERYSGFYQMTKPTLLIKDPDLIKQITVKDFDHFVNHQPFVTEDMDLIWSKNLLSLKEQKWKEMRSVLSPCFTSSKMKIMFHLLNDISITFLKYFQEKVNNNIVEVEMKDVLSRFGNDVIASVAFGMQVDSLRDQNNTFYLMGKEATDGTGFIKVLRLLGYQLFPKIYNILQISFFGKEVTKFFYDLIDETIKVREEKGIVRPDMIHLMLEARKNAMESASQSSTMDITNLDIAAQAFVFFFAGFDSITNTMAFMAYELAVNPDIQRKLRDEIDRTHKHCKGKLSYDALMTMKYMDMVISETMRKWPNFPIMDRVCTKSYIVEPVDSNERALYIKKGEVIFIPILSIHRDPKYYPDPEKFDPERFSEENKHKLNPATFLGFGMGPRNCIGSRLALMECKTIFYYLLLNFELVPVKKTTIPKKLAKTVFSVVAEGGHWLGLKTRG